MAKAGGPDVQGLDRGRSSSRAASAGSSAWAKGSVNPPRMIELTLHGGRAGHADRAHRARGSRSTPAACRSRTPKGMETMKCDMGGAASILATMQVIARLKPKINVIAAIPCSREHAQRHGAEARRRHHAPRRHHERGAQHRRGGPADPGRRARLPRREEPAAASSTRRRSPAPAWSRSATDITGRVRQRRRASRRTWSPPAHAVGEPIWQMPLWQDYRPLIDSKVADIKNVGNR